MADERYSDPPVSPLKQKYLQTRQIANQKDHLRTKFRDQCLQRAKDMRLQSTFEARMKNARAQQFGTFPQHDNGQEQIRQLVRDEYGQLAIGDNEDDRLSAQDLEDIMAYLSETLQQEERQQELQMLEQEATDVEQWMQGEAQSLVAVQNLVVCPICKKNPLYQNNRIIFCRCGMRVDTKSDSINLRYLQTVLLDSVQEHGLQCPWELGFQVRDMPGFGPSVVCGCDNCGTFQVIL